MVIVVENTYPSDTRAAHAEPGDVVRWETPHRGTDGMRLIRASDGKCVFVAPAPKVAGAWDSPVVGVVAEVKNKGWRLVLEMVS